MEPIRSGFALVERTESLAQLPHDRSWVMFTPTELLRSYVRDAFSREGIPVSRDFIKTWENFRQDLARNIFNILKSPSGGGTYTLKKNANYLDKTTLSKFPELYVDFADFFQQETASEFFDAAQKLSGHRQSKISKIGKSIVESLGNRASPVTVKEVRQLNKSADKISEEIDRFGDEAEKIVTLSINILLNDDHDFLDEFREHAAEVLSATEEQSLEDENADSEEESQMKLDTSGSINLTKALSIYKSVLRSIARAKVRNRKLSAKSRNGQLANWLGDRVPTDEILINLGNIINSQSQLRFFQNPLEILLRPARISSRYRKFRSQRQKEGNWYVPGEFRSNEITGHEVDLILLLLFRSASNIIQSFDSLEVRNNLGKGTIAKVLGVYRNQILVDEATDFSAIQLSLMSELSNPFVRSFFICGDFNQRLTSYGASSQAEIDWACSKIECRTITTSYRQSRYLVGFAKEIAILNGGKSVDIILPDRVDIDGVKPVLLENGGDEDVLSAWLKDRIVEIEKLTMVEGHFPSIGVLVNSEGMAQPIAKALGEELVDLNLDVVAFTEGQDIGNNSDIRVFDVQHIKGLEFEAVFFIDINNLIQKYPDLFNKYIYVGATRAATYLGLTCNGNLPVELEHLKGRFTTSWLT